MKRREVVTPANRSGWPAEFAVGRCIEVWAATKAESPGASAMSRFRKAREAFYATQGLSWVEGTKQIPLALQPPHSVAYMCTTGREARVVARFAAAGVTLDDIPALRRAAQAWLAKVPA